MYISLFLAPTGVVDDADIGADADACADASSNTRELHTLKRTIAMFSRGFHYRPGCTKHPNKTTPTRDEVINKVWECVRFNNGIMALLQLIQVVLI